MRLISEEDYRVLLTHLPVVLSAQEDTTSVRLANAKRMLRCLSNKLARNTKAISYKSIHRKAKK